MVSISGIPVSATPIEDVLAHLPVSRTTEYGTGQLIYGPGDMSASIYLAVTGRVLLSRVTAHGASVLLDIVAPEEIFGESSFLDPCSRAERAIAAEPTKVMAWAVSNIEDLVTRRPRLALALLQILAQRNAQAALRIESFATDSIEQRLARSLLGFSERLGTLEEDGAERMMPLTHILLSQYVGTSREIVTHYMTRFRKQGHVRYSRSCIVLYRNTLKSVLNNSVPLAPAVSD